MEHHAPTATWVKWTTSWRCPKEHFGACVFCLLRNFLFVWRSYWSCISCIILFRGGLPSKRNDAASAADDVTWVGRLPKPSAAKVNVARQWPDFSCEEVYHFQTTILLRKKTNRIAQQGHAGRSQFECLTLFDIVWPFLATRYAIPNMMTPMTFMGSGQEI